MCSARSASSGHSLCVTRARRPENGWVSGRPLTGVSGQCRSERPSALHLIDLVGKTNIGDCTLSSSGRLIDRRFCRSCGTDGAEDVQDREYFPGGTLECRQL